MNIYILTEEKPKIFVVKRLLEIYKNDFGGNYVIDNDLLIMPIFNGNYFSFAYEVWGVKVEGINKIILKIVSGSSSFIDFLFFVNNKEPLQGDGTKPLFAVEETKTSDDESRNTGVYQRCSKFVFIKSYYNDIPLYMLYNDESVLCGEKKPSDTSIFGTNMLLTIGVKIVGKPVNKWFHKFSTIEELINFKNNMRRPPIKNTPMLINKYDERIEISARLDKPKNEGKIAHDPNIGALSIIAATLRHLGWKKRIIVTKHGVEQEYLTKTQGKNKFLYICSVLNVQLEGLIMPKEAILPLNYWHYEMSSEKLTSILLHIVAEISGFKEVYQNHAGCERGYFRSSTNKLITLPKKTPNGNNLLIPDLIFNDDIDKIIYLIEGKKLTTLKLGLEEIHDYNDIEELYIRKYYPKHNIKRAVTIFGGNLPELPDENVLVYLRDDGKTIINENDKIIKTIFDYCENAKIKSN